MENFEHKLNSTVDAILEIIEDDAATSEAERASTDSITTTTTTF